MRTPIIAALCSALLGFWTGCEKPTPEPGEPTPSATAATTAAATATATAGSSARNQTEEFDKLMEDHFTKALAMRTSVINGKLDELDEPAKWFAAYGEVESLPPNWQPHMKAMMAAAKATNSKDLAVAAKGVGDIGKACGSCHEAAGGPKVEVPDKPAEASGAKPHMDMHIWAADRLWEGLMAPSGEAWNAGAEALSGAPLTKEEMGGDKSIPEVTELAKKVHTLGADASKVDKPEERAQLYGELVATCSACHDELGVKIP